MSSYLLQGRYALREGVMMGCPDERDQGVLLAWGLWEQPDADNDKEWEDDDGPEAA